MYLGAQGVVALFLVATLLALPLSAAADTEATSGTGEWFVDPVSGIDGASCGSVLRPCKTLRRTVMVARKGGIVRMRAGRYADECMVGGGVLINKSLTIIGEERVVVDCIFNGAAINFINAREDASSTLRLTNVVFANGNTTFAGGAAVRVGLRCSLLISGCHFASHTAGILAEGSVIPILVGTLYSTATGSSKTVPLVDANTGKSIDFEVVCPKEITAPPSQGTWIITVKNYRSKTAS
jgi:hypothetical protein